MERQTISPAARAVAQTLDRENLTVGPELVAILQLVDGLFPELAFRDFLRACAELYAEQLPVEGRA